LAELGVHGVGVAGHELGSDLRVDAGREYGVAPRLIGQEVRELFRGLRNGWCGHTLVSLLLTSDARRLREPRPFTIVVRARDDRYARLAGFALSIERRVRDHTFRDRHAKRVHARAMA